ncbi:Obg family GTPase CgtA, partial [Blochmannia endosymbiont of Polyrhachis (Hedomyrma) turneri]|uniref:Obg family GTPase CgtA n=1 Tax=Blochmannia endosymbiont of Polyrhachis (Hedomyrma) turneri TaxID=1505596 RepID=UPI00061A77C4
MRFIDTADIVVRSGNAGSTVVHFKKQKRGGCRYFVNYGGNGGNVWLITDRNLNTLEYFSFKRSFFAEHGQNGRSRGCRGRSGRDVFIRVPIGTRVYDRSSNELIADLVFDSDELMIVKGGVCSSLGCGKFRNRKKYSTYQELVDFLGVSSKSHECSGNQRDIRLELLLLADVGMLGLPNSGKSTFVRAVSAAKPKVANYPFTTLFPCLGVVYVNGDRFVIADIPGLIQGASVGLGLGISFLKHLQRCRMLLHIIDIVPIEYSVILDNVRIIMSELKSYSRELACKPIWLIFNKIDLLSINELNDKVRCILHALDWKNKYYLISSKNQFGLKELCLDLIKFIND